MPRNGLRVMACLTCASFKVFISFTPFKSKSNIYSSLCQVTFYLTQGRGRPHVASLFNLKNLISRISCARIVNVAFATVKHYTNTQWFGVVWPADSDGRNTTLTAR